MISYLDDRLAIDRLKREYETYRKLVIGLDFDNTIYDYHSIGLDMEPIIRLVKQCNNLGFTLCLYTASLGDLDQMTLYDKVKYCERLGIFIDFVNGSPLNLGESKPFFSILLDDRAGLASAYNVLRTTLMELELIVE